METSPKKHVETSPKLSTPDEIFTPTLSPILVEELSTVSMPPSSSPRKSPISAQRLKSFFHGLQRDSRHVLTNKKMKIAQLWEGRKWRRMSAEEVEPFAEMEERELTSYGATDVEECNANHRKTNTGC